MHFIEQGMKNPIAVIDEFTLHDLLASSQQVLLESIIPEHDEETLAILHDECGIVERFKIVPTEPDKFTPELVAKWEQKLYELVRMLQVMDGEIHEDAEYTC